MSLLPRVTHIAPYERRRVFLQWALEGVDPSTPSPVFTVERSSNHYNDFEVIATGVTDPFYVDTFEDTDSQQINILNTSRSLVYRIGVAVEGPAEDIIYGPSVDLNGDVFRDPLLKEVPAVGILPGAGVQSGARPESYLAPHWNLNRRLQLLRRAKVRRTMVALRYFTGTEIAVLKRRHFGKRCINCWSPDAGVTVVTRCQDCFGTGWEGGFHTPILSLAKISVSPMAVARRTEGDSTSRQARVGLPPFPEVQFEDVIVEFVNNRRWFVHSVDPGVFRGRKMKQFATCSEIGRTGVEHMIEADPENKNLLAYSLGTA